MTEEFKKMNAKYNDETYPEFPFISRTKVHLLQKGLYRKHKAKYRGVTAVFDETTEEFTFPLYGMYYVPEDIIIIPEELNINEKKKAFINAALTAGYKSVNQPPTFKSVYFPENSPEARLALSNKADFYRAKKDNITI